MTVVNFFGEDVGFEELFHGCFQGSFETVYWSTYKKLLLQCTKSLGATILDVTLLNKCCKTLRSGTEK